MNYLKIKNTVRGLLDGENDGSGLDRIFYWSLLSLIFINIAAIIIESVPSVKADPTYHNILNKIEVYSLYIFFIEYVLRIWTADKKIKFAVSPMGLVDLIALMPLLLPLVGVDIRAIGWLRAVRVFRVAKAFRFIPGMVPIKNVLVSKRKELTASLILVGVMMLCAATGMYYIEGSTQPEHFGSIPSSMWWAVTTMTTTGYGDAYPVTAIGKVFGAFFQIFGIFSFALPTAIVGSGFIDELNKRNNE